VLRNVSLRQIRLQYVPRRPAPSRRLGKEPEPTSVFKEVASESDARDFDEMDMEPDMKDVYYGYDIDELD
jgi:hypothetical protein